MNTNRYMVIRSYDHKVIHVFTRNTGISTNWIGVGTQGKLWRYPNDDVELYPGSYIAHASPSVGIGTTYKINILNTAYAWLEGLPEALIGPSASAGPVDITQYEPDEPG